MLDHPILFKDVFDLLSNYHRYLLYFVYQIDDDDDKDEILCYVA